jgi:hypothetical protein
MSYTIREQTSQTRKIREPWQVIDTETLEVVDQYASKRAAFMDAKERNMEAYDDES